MGDLRRLELTMNCAQCQAANGPDAVFCGSCGARLAPAGTPAGAGGYTSAPGTPSGYNTSDSSVGYGYGAPGGYGPASGQAPTGHPQGQYQPGASDPNIRHSSGMPPVNFDLNRLTTVDKTVGVATLITMISLWLPWFSGHYSVLGVTDSGSISGIGDHSWLWLEFVLALALIVYLAARAAWDQLPFNLPITDERLLIVGTGLQFALILIGFLAMPSTDGIQGLSVSRDFGAFLALIASIAAFGPVIYPLVKSYQDSHKGAGPQAY
jgi:hypothetical protein